MLDINLPPICNTILQAAGSRVTCCHCRRDSHPSNSDLSPCDQSGHLLWCPHLPQGTNSFSTSPFAAAHTLQLVPWLYSTCIR